MPTLDWIGKDKVINHHQDVPYRVLERQYSFDEQGQHAEDNGSENMVIHGDNLEALKSLLPRYEGKVKCIYIDPPYNTGNEGWVYNDNVNDPKIKKWLGEVVGREGEDLSRHDKWLCMMYPRLKLLQKLLAEDGVIFISIDTNELYNLKSICDEIIGSNCFVSDISWQRVYCPRNDSKGIPSEVDHILVYSKTPGWTPERLERTADMDDKYSAPDGDINIWTSAPAHAPGAPTHQGMVYAIQHPITGELMYPPIGRCWTFGQDKMLERISEWNDYELREIDDFEKRNEICRGSMPVPTPQKAIMLVSDSEDSRKRSQSRYDAGSWPLLYFTSGGKGGMRCKKYLCDMPGKIVTNLWHFTEVGHTDEALKELKKIFGGKVVFDTPKPPRLIERILQIVGDDNAIVLDSFAGSGTTAHAVLNMNKADGGNRKFILVEMMDYADSITAERVKRVIQGYGEDKKAVPGTGGSFSYYELGKPLMNGDNLNEEVGLDKIREYIWYTETKADFREPDTDKPYYLGSSKHTAYYFFYKPDKVCVLNHEFLSTITVKQDNYVIYADRCAISAEDLQKFGIIFKKIPRDITLL